MLLFLMGWHFFFLFHWELVQAYKKRTWIWGDSQTVQGLSPNYMDLKNPNYSFVQHGNGYYDLIAFANRLPDSADAIIGLGPLFYRFNNDRTQAGLIIESNRALIEAKKKSIVAFNLSKVLRENFNYEFSLKNFDSDDHDIYPNQTDSIKRLSYIKNILTVIESNDFAALFEFKDKWLFRSIDQVAEKSRQFYVVSWPVCDQLSTTRFNGIQDHYDLVLNEMSQKYSMPFDTIEIMHNGDPFYDATHLSQGAVIKVSEEIGKSLKSNSENRIIVIRFLKS
jgi:hypothetical protein